MEPFSLAFAHDLLITASRRIYIEETGFAVILVHQATKFPTKR